MAHISTYCFLSKLVTSIIYVFSKTVYLELTTKLGKLAFLTCWNHAFELMIPKASFTLFFAAAKVFFKE